KATTSGLSFAGSQTYNLPGPVSLQAQGGSGSITVNSGAVITASSSVAANKKIDVISQTLNNSGTLTVPGLLTVTNQTGSVTATGTGVLYGGTGLIFGAVGANVISITHGSFVDPNTSQTAQVTITGASNAITVASGDL